MKNYSLFFILIVIVVMLVYTNQPICKSTYNTSIPYENFTEYLEEMEEEEFEMDETDEEKFRVYGGGRRSSGGGGRGSSGWSGGSGRGSSGWSGGSGRGSSGWSGGSGRSSGGRWRSGYGRRSSGGRWRGGYGGDYRTRGRWWRQRPWYRYNIPLEYPVWYNYPVVYDIPELNILRYEIRLTQKQNINPFFGKGYSKGFTVNGVSGGMIELQRGQMYEFNIDTTMDNKTGQIENEPFFFTYNKEGGEYKNAVFIVEPISRGTVRITVPIDFPKRPDDKGYDFFYNSTNNKYVGGYVVVN
jgi:hypothetical protein